MIETIDEKGIVEIVHQGPLTAVQVSALKETLTRQFVDNTGVRLNFSETQECDTLGIQLLCVFTRAAIAQKKTFILKGDLDCVLDMAVRTGLTPDEYFLLDKKEN
ncbi:MAG: STAS domain-containing protein [Desulfobacterium sp.]|nr:STAS domain-containing protein [Desulfobacterium sp.]